MPRFFADGDVFDDTDDGRIDPLKYMQYVMSQQRELDERDNLVIIAACDEAAAAAESTAEGKSSSPPPRKRARRDPQMTRERTTGEMRRMRYTDTGWYKNYVESPNTTSKKFQRKFRRRFRCRYDSFQKHLNEVKEHPLFRTWSEHNA